ncbi:MAG TPA: ABC transporter permease [Rugosimonospora sp.]|jgi:ABC-2 type transport system permease protein
MRPALHAEWTKLRTTAGPAWLLLASVTVTVALGAAVTAAITCPNRGCGLDPTRLSLTGIYLSQAPVAILAVLAISGEHSTGLISTTLTAIPHRPAVLTAKATILTLTVAASGGVAFLASLLVARAILPANGFTPAHGYPSLSLANGSTLRAYAGSVLYLVLIALLSLGIGATVRDSAAAIGTVLGLLYLPPILALSIDNPHWQRLLQQAAPMSAGLAIQTTTAPSTAPIGPWAGLAVLAAWAAGAFLTGTLVLQRRDT